MMGRLMLVSASAMAVLWLCFGGARLALAEEARGDAQLSADEDDVDDAPTAAARRWLHAEPVGSAPSPWIALSGTYDMGVAVDGDTAWTALRVHVPVARRYGAVDVRLAADLDREGLESLGPEFVLRGVPLRLADGRGGLGFALSMYPRMQGFDPLLTLGGGIMGGYLGQWWFAWAHLGVRGEVLQRGYPELLSTVGFGLRLPYGLRPQVEVDLLWETRHNGELSLALRPALRYWPSEAVGIGISADLWLMGDDGIETSAIRLDLVFHAME